MAGYHDIMGHKKIRKCDSLFAKFDCETDMLLQQLETRPDDLISQLWSYNGILGYDDHCQYNLGTGQIHCAATCQMCIQLHRLIDLKRNKYDKPFMIETGGNMGRMIICRAYEKQSYIFQRSSSPGNIVEKINRYVADNFTVHIIGLLALRKLSEQRSILNNSENMIITAFVCNKRPYTLSYYYDPLDITPEIATRNNIIEWIRDIAQHCKLLQELTICVNVKELNLVERRGLPKINIVYDITSVQVGSNHIRRACLKSTGPYIQYRPSYLTFDSESYFKVESPDYMSYTTCCQMGLLTESSVFTFYQCIQLLFQDENIRRVLMSDETLSIWFRSLWYPADIASISANISTISLTDHWLHTDAIDRTITHLLA